MILYVLYDYYGCFGNSFDYVRIVFASFGVIKGNKGDCFLWEGFIDWAPPPSFVWDVVGLLDFQN